MKKIDTVEEQFTNKEETINLSPVDKILQDTSDTNDKLSSSLEQDKVKDYNKTLDEWMHNIVGEWCNNSNLGFYEVGLDFVFGLSYYNKYNVHSPSADISQTVANIKTIHTKLSKILDILKNNPPEDFIETVGDKLSISALEFIRGITDATHTTTFLDTIINNQDNDQIDSYNVLVCNDSISKLYEIVTTEVLMIGEENL